MRMRDAAASDSKACSNRVWRDTANVEPIHIGTTIRQAAALAYDQDLLPAAAGEFANKELYLPLATPECRRKIKVANRWQSFLPEVAREAPLCHPRYQSASRPVILIVIVYGSAMMTMRP